MERTVLEWLVRFGPPTLFFAQVFGLFGLPIPDELLLTLAGALIRKGQLNGPATVVAAVAGALTGMTLSYGPVSVNVLRKDCMSTSRLSTGRCAGFGAGRWLLAFRCFVPGGGTPPSWPGRRRSNIQFSPDAPTRATCCSAAYLAGLLAGVMAERRHARAHLGRGHHRCRRADAVS